MGLRRILAVVSFLIYALTAIIVVNVFRSSWDIERPVSIPAAISNVVYGFQLGVIDSNVLEEFNKAADPGTPASVDKVVERVSRGSLNSGTATIAIDGIGIGQQIFVDLAMRLFGPHLLSMPYCFLLLMGISTLAFLNRFIDSRLIFVPLHYLALTCMLFTPLVTDLATRAGVPIGGNRFFGVLGILPALHICFEFADGVIRDRHEALKNYFLLSIQLLLFVFVMLVRSANAYMLAPAVCVELFTIFRHRHNLGERRRLYRKYGNAAILSIIFGVVLIALVPSYVKAGRIGGLFWHRAFVSYALHPLWPFGNLRDVYNCTKYIPEGLQNTGNVDRNGHCIWWAYSANRTRPESVVQERAYGSEYETAMRKAYFYVLFTYPRQAAELFLYYKPLLLLQTLRGALIWQINSMPLSVVFLAILEAIIFFCFVIDGATKVPFSPTTTFGTLALFALFSLAPPLVAWSTIWTSADIIFYMYAAGALVTAFLTQLATVAYVGKVSTAIGRRAPG